MFSLIVIVCSLAVALAQVPRPCITPPQWEGRLFDYNAEQKFEQRGYLSYDAIYQRERIIEEIEVGDDRDYYDVVALFQAKMEFVYNFRTHNCTRRTIDRAWRDFGIRQGARSYGEAYVGSSGVPGASVLVTIWGGNFTTPENHTVNYFGTWTYQGCLPVSSTSHNSKYGTSHASFFDITPGISDPNVFIPRRECLTAKEYEMYSSNNLLKLVRGGKN